MSPLAYFSLSPLLFCGNAILVASALAVAAIAVRRREGRSLAVGLALIAVVPSVGYWTAYAVFVDVEREMTFNMTWSVAEKSASYPDADHIVLHFKSYPNHFVGIYSTDLRTYLEKLPSRDVAVTFRVTTDFGRTRGYHQVRIGDLTSWNASGEYGGSAGNYMPSPWP